jgi:hypothetical protein
LKESLKAINEELARFDAADYYSDEELVNAKTLQSYGE